MKKSFQRLTVCVAASVTMVFVALFVANSAQATNAADPTGLPPAVWAEQPSEPETTAPAETTQPSASSTSAPAETTPAPTTARPTTTKPTTTKPTTTRPTTTKPTTTKPSQPTVTAPAATQSARTLEELYGNLSGSTRGCEAIQARISGNVLTIDAYVNFRGAYDAMLGGQTRASLAKQGFRLWAGAYRGSRHDFEPGMAFTVKVNIHDIYNGAGARGGQNYFDFVCLSETGRSFTFYGVGYYNREMLGTYDGAIPDKSYTNGAIGMYSGLSGPYTANQYIKVSAHEFGHVLGLGDLYKKGVAPTEECPQGELYVGGDIMGSHGAVTPNNIEMMLAAYTTGWYQAYVNSSPEVKSKAIRSY